MAVSTSYWPLVALSLAHDEETPLKRMVNSAWHLPLRCSINQNLHQVRFPSSMLVSNESKQLHANLHSISPARTFSTRQCLRDSVWNTYLCASVDGVSYVEAARSVEQDSVKEVALARTIHSSDRDYSNRASQGFQELFTLLIDLELCQTHTNVIVRIMLWKMGGCGTYCW